MEVWKDVIDYEGYYEVSDFGQIRRKDNITVYKDGRKAHFTPKIIKQSIDKKGYYRIRISKKSIQKTIRVHIVVADAFLDRRKYNLYVDHIDDDKSNNKANNLRLITNRENCSKGKKNKTSKYTGVSFDKAKNKWASEIRWGKERFRLGRFKNEIEASNAYQNKLKELLNG